MRWCLRAKLEQHYDTFSKLLCATEDLPIVELSKTDNFWGARPHGVGMLEGRNVLGRLLMELREEINKGVTPFNHLDPLVIPDFFLLSEKIEIIEPIPKNITEEKTSRDNNIQIRLPFDEL